MAPIPLPRRGVRSAILLGLVLWICLQLVRRLNAATEGSYEDDDDDDWGAVDAGTGAGAQGKRGRVNPDAFDPALALGAKQKQKLQPPVPPAGKGGRGKVIPPQGRAAVNAKAKAKAKAAVGAKGKAAPKGKGKGKGLPKHRYLDNGLLQVNPKGQHPIYDLLERGRETWDGKLAKASQTLAQAVNEYRRRYGRAPPKGFDRWWKYAQENDVQLPDEYDQIHKDLDPFHALTPSTIQSLIRTAAGKSGMYTIYCPGSNPDLPPEDQECVYDLNEEGLNEEGLVVARQRVEAQMSLVRDIQGELEEVEAVFYCQDVPWQFVGHEYLDWAHLGWASACAPHKPLRKSYDVTTYPVLDDLWAERAKTFIWDHRAAMDPCIHPTMTHLQGFLSGHGKGPGPSKELYPVMAMCKTTLHSDVLAVSMEAWTEDVGHDPPWEEKTDDRLLWRGKNTGIFYKPGVPWEISQRMNLLSRTAQTSGTVPVLALTPANKPVGMPHNTPLSDLNDDLVDIAFTNEPIQCEPAECERIKEEYRYGGRMDWQSANAYKYMLDIDGNGWSARFKRLMTTNSAILKSTIFPEWYTDRIQPWVHYIPIKSDLTDLYDVLTFFKGGHDELAKQIAVEGKEWSKTFWRKEDMISYQFRLFLELGRLMAPDREAASYTVKGSELEGI